MESFGVVELIGKPSGVRGGGSVGEERDPMVAWPRGGGYRHQRRGVAGRGGRVGAAVGGSRDASGGGVEGIEERGRWDSEPAASAVLRAGRIGISARSV